MKNHCLIFERRVSELILLTILFLASLFSVSAQSLGTDQDVPVSLSSNDLSASVVAVTKAGGFHSPMDSTPDPFGNFIYFVAIGPHGPGVFRIPAAANSPAVEVAAGFPFVAPTGIAMSSDGLSLYVADAQAWNEDGASGQIFVVPTNGGTPIPLRGAAGTKPRNLDVVNENGREVIYYSGREPRRRQPAIFRLPATGNNTARILAQGEPFIEPDGIAVTRTGVVYVADRASVGPLRGNIFKIKGRSITPITSAIRLGNPAGIALTLDESTLLVSSLQRDGHDQVLLVNLRTLRTQIFTDVVGQNENDAGGLHRAHFSHDFSWCGIAAGASGQGTVYQVNLRP